VTKHRLFVWLTPEVLSDAQLIVFADDDDYTFGLLHSRVHETWARAKGSQLREEKSGFRYTPTSTFETFPLPEPTEARRQTIAAAARELESVRERWLNPPEWTREETITFPASVGGPWQHLVREPDANGIGSATYRRVVAVDDAAGLELARRTLTALYNAPPTWLRDLHAALDATVLAAYGLAPEASDQEVLGHLLALNREGTE
jgi:hypothetical protein